MERQTVAGIRLLAFAVDFSLVIAFIVILSKLLSPSLVLPVEVVMLVCIPLGFFLNWASGLNLGKRIFKIEIIDEATGKTPSIWQYFIRCLLFSLVVSLNLVFIIPIFASKKHRAFHDMMAGTLVVKK